MKEEILNYVATANLKKLIQKLSKISGYSEEVSKLKIFKNTCSFYSRCPNVYLPNYSDFTNKFLSDPLKKILNKINS